jgi:hypothetical protein
MSFGFFSAHCFQAADEEVGRDQFVSQRACRKLRQVMVLPRTGSGSNPLRRRMLSMVELLSV